MTGWTPDVSRDVIIGVGMVQGVGLSFLTVPINFVTLSSLSSVTRAEGAGFSTLMRNLGSSAVITRQAQIIAYIDDYKLLLIATLTVIPLLLVFKKPSGGGATHTIAAPS
jgi:MFS transporter, DHA2 family, multidrug resistance protein